MIKACASNVRWAPHFLLRNSSSLRISFPPCGIILRHLDFGFGPEHGRTNSNTPPRLATTDTSGSGRLCARLERSLVAGAIPPCSVGGGGRGVVFAEGVVPCDPSSHRAAPRPGRNPRREARLAGRFAVNTGRGPFPVPGSGPGSQRLGALARPRACRVWPVRRAGFCAAGLRESKLSQRLADCLQPPGTRALVGGLEAGAFGHCCGSG